MVDDDADSARSAPAETNIDSSAVAPPVPISVRLLALCRSFFLMATALGWGLLLGLLFWRPEAPLPEDPHAQLLVPSSSRTNADPAATSGEHQTALQRLQAADRLLASGSVGSALELYARLWKNPAPPRPYDHLLYRIAVARELVGDPEEALAHYSDVVRLASSERIRVAAQLGQVRVWLAGRQYDLATTTLCELAFNPEIATLPDRELAGWRAHLFALATTFQANARTSVRPDQALEDRGCVSATPTFEGDELLRLPVPPDRESAVTIEPGIAVLYRLGPRPEQTQVRLALTRQSLLEIIEEVAEATGLQLNWTEEAIKRCQVPGRPVLAENCSLATLLDHLLIPVGVAWTWADGQVIVRRPQDMETQALSRVMWERAERAARFASSTHPNHRLAPFVYLTIGNASYRRGDHAGAEATYRQLLQLPASGPTRIEATFNLAKALWNTGKQQEALQTFYRAADMGQGHPIRAAAYLYAGRLLLESGKITESIRPLMRAASLAQTDLSKQAAAVTLSSAYLLADNPHAANTVLMRFRKTLDGNDFEGIAALVAAFARLQVAEPEARFRHGRAVVTALNHVSPTDFFGSFGYLVVGRAFEATGLLQQMADVYEAALTADLPIWIKHETQLALAEHWIETGNYQAAQPLLAELVDSPQTDLSVRATIDLARIDLMQKREDRCLSASQRLLQRELGESEKTAVLLLMGRAHQARSEHYEAALCFAGMVPGSNSAGFSKTAEIENVNAKHSTFEDNDSHATP